MTLNLDLDLHNMGGRLPLLTTFVTELIICFNLSKDLKELA